MWLNQSLFCRIYYRNLSQKTSSFLRFYEHCIIGLRTWPTDKIVGDLLKWDAEPLKAVNSFHKNKKKLKVLQAFAIDYIFRCECFLIFLIMYRLRSYRWNSRNLSLRLPTKYILLLQILLKYCHMGGGSCYLQCTKRVIGFYNYRRRTIFC